MQKMVRVHKKIKIFQISLAMLAMAVCVYAGCPWPAYAAQEGVQEEGVPEEGVQDPDVSTNEPEETPDPYPPSYYLPIESNEIPGWPQGPQVQAESAVLMDVDYGVCLYEKNMHQRQYPASITKIMTALLTIENADLSDVVTFSEDAVYGIEPGSSHIGIDVGEKLTVEQSLYGLMLASANEVAMGLAEHVAGSVGAFVEMMNQRAEELGCEDTHFVNPHGLHDEDHYVTAYDMALIAREAYQNPTFRKVTGTATYEIPETNKEEETRYLINNQKLLSDEYWYYADCRGGKTGFTDQALNTLVTYAKRDNRTLVCVDMKTNGIPIIYPDTTALLDYGFGNFTWEHPEKEEDVRFQAPFGCQQGFYRDLEEACWLRSYSPGWVLLPQGISTSDLEKKRATEPNAVGPWRIKTSYYCGSQYIGYSYQYEDQLLRSLSLME